VQNKAAKDCLTSIIAILDKEDHERQKLSVCEKGHIYPASLPKCPECGSTDRCRAEDCYRK